MFSKKKTFIIIIEFLDYINGDRFRKRFQYQIKSHMYRPIMTTKRDTSNTCPHK